MEYQLKIENFEVKSCAFTGHRDFGGEDNLKKLEAAVRELIENGINTFYCGMAVGFDLACAEAVIKLKKHFSIKIIACIPCPEQDKYFPSAIKRRYREALNNCDEIIVLAPSYFTGCMQLRDRYMVDNCDVVLSFLSKNTGGTYYTVNYAKKHGKQIIQLI